MNILFTVNRGYLEHLEDCVQSIIRYPSEDGYDIYIIHSDLEKADENRLEKLSEEYVRFHFIYVDPEENYRFPETDRYPMEIYYRIFASFLLPNDVDRILYLDADTLVINPLQALYHTPFRDNYMLACTHIRKTLSRINRLRLGIKDDRPYINSGVMLMNLRKLRENQRIEDITGYVEKYKNVLTLPDQDIITALYGDKVGLLDTMRYNLSDRILSFYNADLNHEKIDLDWVREHAVIIHYCGKNKPWKKGYRGILHVFYKELKQG